MVNFKRPMIAALILAMALVVAACDDDEDDDTDVPGVSDTTPVTETTPDESPASDEATPETDVDTTPEGDMTPEMDTTPGMDDTPEVDATPGSDATPDGDTTPAAEGDAEEILDEAAERASELDTVKFRLDGTGSIQVEDIGEVSLSNAEGAVERPDRAQVEFDLDVAGMEVPLTVVSIDDDVYFTDVFSGEWQSAPEEFQFNPGIIFDEDEGIPALIRSVEDAELLGTAKVDDRDVYHISGVIDRELIETGTSGVFQPTDDVDLEVWIDQETSDVILIRAEDPTAETESVWEMEIFDHNEPVEIEEPDVSSS